MPILLFGLNCLTLAKTDLQSLEHFQGKAVKWTMGQNEDATRQMQLLEILQLPMYLQLNRLLTLSKVVEENCEHNEVPEINV